MEEIVMQVIPGEEDEGGFTAWWDDAPGRGGITTEGDSLGHLEMMVREAVLLYFEGRSVPKRIRLHFQHDPIIFVNDEASAGRKRAESETSLVEAGI